MLLKKGRVMVSEDNTLSFKPVNEKNWPDMQDLFGEKGAYGGCWCTYWRMKRSEFNSLSNPERKSWMDGKIKSGTVPGILAYKNNEPVGWCSFGRRKEFPVLENSRILKRVDGEEVWSVVCFYIKKNHRREGIMRRLLLEVLRLAESGGASIVEGYPIDPSDAHYPDPYAYTGLMKAFLSAGFVEVIRRSEKRPIMRYYLSHKGEE